MTLEEWKTVNVGDQLVHRRSWPEEQESTCTLVKKSGIPIIKITEVKKGDLKPGRSYWTSREYLYKS